MPLKNLAVIAKKTLAVILSAAKNPESSQPATILRTFSTRTSTRGESPQQGFKTTESNVFPFTTIFLLSFSAQ